MRQCRLWVRRTASRTRAVQKAASAVVENPAETLCRTLWRVERMRCLLPLWLGASLPGLLWAATALLVEGDSDPSRICKAAPNWQVGGKAPMQDLLGSVVVVALLKAS
ncbi:hypothetical protein NHX12_004822 [Muraenolepis orangiensis]|uniref:Selenoprotein P N-terminal domain-containing protein n=1 Tax=Muraenolepis orangiensis TaxID=630683 RepID=A0A9Q0DTG3_9TELE|nr:hypothetical protein NHX12_004822 [Muraenolepis orangiensis]